MSKELKALDSIMVSLAKYKEYAIDKLPTKAKEIREENDDDFLIIEAALKRLEQLQIIIGAEKIEDLPKVALETENACYSNSYNLKKAEKKLKALEIIKEKRVDVSYLIICIEQDVKPLQFYNEMTKDLHNGELTQEEYDLLKKVLL